MFNSNISYDIYKISADWDSNCRAEKMETEGKISLFVL